MENLENSRRFMTHVTANDAYQARPASDGQIAIYCMHVFKRRETIHYAREEKRASYTPMRP